MKNYRGITLIALIITIIVLLILAGVTMSMISGENGIITKVSKVEIEYSKGEIRELLLLQVNAKLLKASEKIDGTSEDISKYFNEKLVIDYLSGVQTEDEDEESPGVNCLTPDPTATTIKAVNGEDDIYTVYIIDPLALSDSVDSYGKGKSLADKDVFTLEVMQENGKSTGQFELKYYDNDGNSTVIETLTLYLTNQS
jgi:hypothetical protein